LIINQIIEYNEQSDAKLRSHLKALMATCADIPCFHQTGKPELSNLEQTALPRFNIRISLSSNEVMNII
jgi:hypothetical protein